MKKNKKEEEKAIKKKEYKPQKEFKKAFFLTDTFSYRGKIFSVLV